jgi:hypothetical protein
MLLNHDINIIIFVSPFRGQFKVPLKTKKGLKEVQLNSTRITTMLLQKLIQDLTGMACVRFYVVSSLGIYLLRHLLRDVNTSLLQSYGTIIQQNKWYSGGNHNLYRTASCIDCYFSMQDKNKSRKREPAFV